MQRRGRERCRARPADGQLVDERGQLVALDSKGVTPAIGKERAELSQVDAVRRERVARQSTLQLEVGQEVEHESLERLGSPERDSSHNAMFAGADAIPPTSSTQTLLVRARQLAIGG